MPDDRCFIASESRGLIDFQVDLGDSVTAGQVVAQVYDPERSGAAPVAYRAAVDGLLIGRHFPGMIGMGDCLAVLAQAKA